MDSITYKQYTIDRWYIIVPNNTSSALYGEYPTMKAAKKALKQYPNCHIEAACAERIDKDGNLNPAVYAPNMTAAVRKIKSIL